MQAVQIKMARAALGLTVEELATKAGLAPSAIEEAEGGKSGDQETFRLLNLFFSANGIELIDSDGVRSKPQPGKDFVTVDQLTTDNDGGEG